MIQLIYDDKDQLIDCEFGHDRNQTKLFLINFKKELNNVSSSNISVESLDDSPLPRELQWIDYSYLKGICKRKHREIKNRIRRNKMIDKTDR